MPVPEFVVNGIPDGVSEVEIPVVFFDVNNSIKWGALFTLVVEDAGVINAVIQFLILAASDVDNETKFDVDNRFDFGGHFGDFRQRSRVRFPLCVNAIRSHAYFGFAFCHVISVVCRVLIVYPTIKNVKGTQEIREA